LTYKQRVNKKICVKLWGGGWGQILLSLQALNPQKIPLTNIVNDEIKLDKDAKVLGFWEGLTFK
jgi:hypothetical protein